MATFRLPARSGPAPCLTTHASEVGLWVYNQKRDEHRRIRSMQFGGINWNRTNDLYDVNVAL